MLDGARWRWTSDDLAAADAAIFAELERLAEARA